MDNLFYEYILNPSKRIYWLYILSSILISLVYLYFHKNERKLLFSRKYWFHKSTRLDFYYFFISHFIKVLILLPMLFGVKEVAIFTYRFLLKNFGFYLSDNFTYMQIVLFYTLAIFIFSDLSRYFLHRFLHTNKFLWRFHKVHHSAKILNPLTFYRVHPLENFLFGLRYSLIIGIITGIFIYFFGAKFNLYSIFGVNIFLFIFSLLGTNLRHSPIKLSYFKYLEYIFISPRQHQIHHSVKFYNKNFGGYLAIWDTLFGSLKLSSEAKITKLGLRKKEMKNYETVGGLLFSPLIFKRKEKKNEYKECKKHNFMYFRNIFAKCLYFSKSIKN